jgi:hypothetical protein
MKERRKTAPMEPVGHIIVADLEAKKEILVEICCTTGSGQLAMKKSPRAGIPIKGSPQPSPKETL